MKKLPIEYQWLEKEPAPKMLLEALSHYGELEIPGPKSAASILKWAQELGLANIYTTDSIPWCGLFMAILAKRSGYGMDAEEPGKRLPFTYQAALWARNWSRFGKETKTAELGDILVFSRAQGSGHVGLYVGEDDTHYHVLAGNQGDKVCISRILKGKCISKRRPPYKVQPSNVRVVKLHASGEVFSDAA